LRSHRLVALEPFTEIMGSHQAALDQKLEGAVHRRGTHPLTLLPQLAADAFDGKMVLGEKDDLGYEIPLAGDRLVVLAEMAAEAVGVGGCLCLIQSGH
jgi:hypothetical protein